MSSLLTYDNFVHALAGSVASGTAMTLFYPLDTVKSRLQLEDDREVKNSFATLIELVRKEGLPSLYKGLEPVLYSLFASNFIYFYSFHGIRRMTGDKNALKDLTIGAFAGVVNVLTTTPMWVVNTRIKMRGTNKTRITHEKAEEKRQQHDFTSISDGLLKIVQTEGVGALWAGTIPSLVLVTNPALQFTIFEMLKRNMKRMLEQQELSPFHVFTLGAISKSISTIISYPLQIVQTKRRYGAPDVKNKSMLEILSQLARDGSLYKGMEAKLLQTVMTTALMFVFYERIYSFVTTLSKSVLVGPRSKQI